MADSEDYTEEATPTAHKTSHQDGGTDEISITGLSGIPAALAAHALLPTVHQDAPALIGAHALLAGIHHIRYTDLEVTAVVNAMALLPRDGSLPLTADWDIGDGRHIKADKIRARDADGLRLEDDGGKGIEVTDRGIIHTANQSGCRVYLSAPVAIATNTWTLVPCDLEIWDSQSEFNTGTHLFTASKAGKYLAIFDWHLSLMLPGKIVKAMIRKNGAVGPPYHWDHQATLDHTGGTISLLFDLALNDTLGAWVFQDTGVNKDLDSIYTTFAVSKIA